jgi:hypothetical protein
VAEGTPEQVAQTDGSYTGKFLRELLPRFDGKHTGGKRAGKPGVARGA